MDHKEIHILEELSIDELVDLNHDIQEVLKRKRKARVCSEKVFGSRVKIEIDRDSNGEIKRGVLKIKQRYNSDSYITILASNPDSFKKELLELSESIAMSHMYMTQITNNKEKK